MTGCFGKWGMVHVYVQEVTREGGIVLHSSRIRMSVSVITPRFSEEEQKVIRDIALKAALAERDAMRRRAPVHHTEMRKWYTAYQVPWQFKDDDDPEAAGRVDEFVRNVLHRVAYVFDELHTGHVSMCMESRATLEATRQALLEVLGAELVGEEPDFGDEEGLIRHANVRMRIWFISPAREMSALRRLGVDEIRARMDLTRKSIEDMRKEVELRVQLIAEQQAGLATLSKWLADKEADQSK